MKKWIFRIVLLVILMGLAGGYYLYSSFMGMEVKKSGSFYIFSDRTEWNYVQKDAINEGFIDGSQFLDKLVEIKKVENLKPGHYVLTEGENVNDVLNKWKSGNQDPLRVIINGSSGPNRLAAVLGNQLEIDSVDWADYFRSSTILDKLGMSKANWSSIILPNTYELYWNTSEEGFIERMQTESQRFWKENASALKNSGLTKEEVICLASITEKETAMVDEMPIVAGLYFNRLKSGWKLQSDPTIIAGIQSVYPDSVIKRVYFTHLAFDSPYNTYMYEGLPPGPLNIPSIQAVKAVLNPARHSYFYMVASVDRMGYHEFNDSKNLARHNRYAKVYQQYLSRLEQN